MFHLDSNSFVLIYESDLINGRSLTIDNVHRLEKTVNLFPFAQDSMKRENLLSVEKRMAMGPLASPQCTIYPIGD